MTWWRTNTILRGIYSEESKYTLSYASKACSRLSEPGALSVYKAMHCSKSKHCFIIWQFRGNPPENILLKGRTVKLLNNIIFQHVLHVFVSDKILFNKEKEKEKYLYCSEKVKKLIHQRYVGETLAKFRGSGDSTSSAQLWKRWKVSLLF